MLIAVTVHEGRIAPVFDVAACVLLFDSSAPETRTPLSLPRELPDRAAVLFAAKVSHLVCGAISRAALFFLMAEGIRVTGFVAGDIDTVIRAIIDGRVELPEFAMPGCSGRQRPCCRRHRRRNNNIPGQKP